MSVTNPVISSVCDTVTRPCVDSLVVSSSFSPDDVSSLTQWLFSSTSLTSTQVVDEREGTGTARDPQPGRCYDFDGTDDHVDTGYQVSASATQMSACGWVNLDSLGNYQHILGSINSGSNKQLTLRVDNDNKAQFGTFNGSHHQAKSTSTLSTGTWYFIAGTYDGSEYKLYVDGSLVATTIDSTFAPDDTSNIFVGARNGTGGAADFLLDGQLYGVGLWDTALTASQISDLYNDGTIPTSNLEFFYKCDESDGTTAYDSSGSSNDGTITNATLGTFHATDTAITKSWLNDVGYSDGAGSVKVPRDESDTANDVTGSALDYTGEVPYNVNLVESNCGTFDGTDDYIDVPTDLFESRSTFSYGCWFTRASGTSDYERIMLRGKSSNSTRISLSFGGVSVGSTDGLLINFEDGSTTYGYVDSVISGDDVWHHAIVVYNGGGATNADKLKLYVNGTQQTLIFSGTIPSSITLTGENFGLGGNSDGGDYLGGMMYNALVCSNALTSSEVSEIMDGDYSNVSLIALHPFSEGAGTTIYDVSGNDNHGTATNITAASFWAGTQDNFHWNITKGFREDSGTKIPALEDGIAAADTNAITNPAGSWHNNAETKIQQFDSPAVRVADTNNYWFNGATINAKSYSDIVANVNSANKIFADVATGKQYKTILSFTTALSGSDLTHIENYTNQ